MGKRREELHEEIVGGENPPVVDKENVNTNREQSVPKTPEENPPVVDVENENASREQFVPRMPKETLDERGAELRATHPPTAEAREIKKLRKKQQRLLNIIAQLRQKIRSLKTSLRIRRTIRRKRRKNAAGSCRMRRQGAYRRPVGQYSADRPTTVPTSTEEQHVVPSDMEHQNVVPSDMEHQNVVPIDTEEQTAVPNSPLEPTVVPIKTEPQDDIPFTEAPSYPFIHVKKERENKAVQTDAPPLGIIWDRNSRQ